MGLGLWVLDVGLACAFWIVGFGCGFCHIWPVFISHSFWLWAQSRRRMTILIQRSNSRNMRSNLVLILPPEITLLPSAFSDIDQPA